MTVQEENIMLREELRKEKIQSAKYCALLQDIKLNGTKTVLELVARIETLEFEKDGMMKKVAIAHGLVEVAMGKKQYEIKDREVISQPLDHDLSQLPGNSK